MTAASVVPRRLVGAERQRRHARAAPDQRQGEAAPERCGLTGATNVDWEDLASGPGAGGRRTLYVGDIGDNDQVRDDLVVYRVAEPSRGAAQRRAGRAAVPLPGRPPQRRGALRRPGLGTDLRASRRASRRGPSRAALYRFPLPLRPGRRVTLEKVGGRFAKLVAPVPLVTGAAVSPDGTRLAIRTYTDAWEWRRRPGSPFASLFAARLRARRARARAPGRVDRVHGDGKALVTTSEQLPAPIWRLGSDSPNVSAHRAGDRRYRRSGWKART